MNIPSTKDLDFVKICVTTSTIACENEGLVGTGCFIQYPSGQCWRSSASKADRSSQNGAQILKDGMYRRVVAGRLGVSPSVIAKL